MEYNFTATEKKWQHYWAKHKTFAARNPQISSPLGRSGGAAPKYYVLDMFPYPSGAGLHVGHPLGYIASDIYSRYKRLKGFNVLHPMGYDAFGLPAEQYAIQTGQHPAITTEKNIARYREQLDKIGFSFDWDRQVKTSDPKYYRWTQWIFLKLFNSWYNSETDKAEDIQTLIEKLKVGKLESWSAEFPLSKGGQGDFSWNDLTEKEKSDFLMNYRLAYLSETFVNWCPQMGTVLANEEVKDGVSERGGYPVERKLMKQWSLRITAYSERLLNDLNEIDWSEALKEQQRNWIGKSEGCSITFNIQHSTFNIEVFTTRPDTIFGVSFLTLAPENELVEKITTAEYKNQVEEYIHYAKTRSERERQADVKKVTGQFTGAYCIHPFTGKQIPIWIGDYVLAGYGTGAVMGVPAHDTRDFAFANHFGLEIKKVIEPNQKHTPDPSEKGGNLECFDIYDGYCINSDFIDGLQVKDAIKSVIKKVEELGIGKGKINYRLRDAIFGRQRYWGEPIPIYYKDGIPMAVQESDLPVELPEVDKYLPTETGEPPLARADNWTYSPFFQGGKGDVKDKKHTPDPSEKEEKSYPLELTTMPGWAASSWYYLRYMDAHNDTEFVSKDAVNYWQQVDLYIGGSEHATGHLLYVRFWTKFLHDLGYLSFTEPAKKLINQGMIQGVSEKMFNAYTTHARYLDDDKGWENVKRNLEFYNRFESYDIINKFMEENPTLPFPLDKHIEISLVENSILNIEKFIEKKPEFKNYIFECEGGFWQKGIFHRKNNGSDKFYTKPEVEKMSKSKLNVVTPDDIIEKYGADCLRLYEMFLGPLEQSKPWNTNGISGVSNFIRKLWKLYHQAPPDLPKGEENSGANRTSLSFGEGQGEAAELRILHKTIKKIQDDIERFSFNTSVSNFMICVNELTELKCNKREILEPLAILVSPYAPHIAEELWEKLGHKESICYATFPEYKEEYTIENTFNYPISFNGKTRFFMEFDLSVSKEEMEREVLAAEQTQKYLEGKTPKKIIIVPKKIVNIVL